MNIRHKSSYWFEESFGWENNNIDNNNKKTNNKKTNNKNNNEYT